MHRTSSVAVLLCATLSAHGLQLRSSHFAPRVTGTAVALPPRSPLLTQPLVLAATPPCLSRGQSPTMRAAPPAGFEWGEVDRERTSWFDSLPSVLRRVGKPLLLLGVFSAIASLPSARGRFWGLYHAYEAAAIARPLITKSATSGVAYLLGDTIAQRRSAAGPISRGRLTRATIAGAVSHGPQLHYWTVKLPLPPPLHPPLQPPPSSPSPASPHCAPPRALPRPRALPPARPAPRPACDGAHPTAPASSRYSSSARACLCSARSLSTRWARYPLTPAPPRRPPPPTPCRPPSTRRPLAASARPRVLSEYSPSSSASSP